MIFVTVLFSDSARDAERFDDIFFFRKNTNCYSYLYRGGRLIFAKNSVLILRNAQKNAQVIHLKMGGYGGGSRGGIGAFLGGWGD